MDELTRALLEARDGDRLALSSFIRVTQGEVWRLACRLVCVEEAEDVTQDVYVRAWRALPSFRGDSTARTWLLSIARRACVDAVRVRVRRRQVAARPEWRCDISSAVADGTDAVAFWELVGALPRHQREAFVLTQVLGCSYAEAAEVCGTPVGTIRSRIARARGAIVDAWEAVEAI